MLRIGKNEIMSKTPVSGELNITHVNNSAIRNRSNFEGVNTNDIIAHIRPIKNADRYPPGSDLSDIPVNNRLSLQNREKNLL